MADKETVGSVVDEGQESTPEVKVQKKASILPMILKWIAIALACMICVVAITIVTVTVMSKKGKGFTDYPTSPEYRDTSEILTYYTNLDTIKTNIAGQPPATIIAKINLGYSKDSKTTPSELSERNIELLDFLRSYFKGKTFDELEGNEEAIKIEIRNLINDNILTTGKIKRVMITQYDLVLQE